MRYVLDFGASNGNLTPPTFTSFADTATQAQIPAPLIYANPAPAWTYYFDYFWPPQGSPQTTSISWGVTLGGVSLSDTISTTVTPSSPSTTATVGIGGTQTLLSLRTTVRTEADIENDPHISDSEINVYLNQSMFRLYDLLIKCFGDNYFSATAQFTTDGVNAQFPLPNGVNLNGAPAYYKGELVEIIAGGSVSQGSPITLHRFNMREKNRFFRPGYAFQIGPQYYPRYRIMGNTILFTPMPTAALQIQLWYAPQLAPLVNDSDVAADMSGWLEYVIIDAAIKCVIKQERSANDLGARLTMIKSEIEEAAKDRDLSEPNTVVETGGEGYAGDYGWGQMGGSGYL